MKSIQTTVSALLNSTADDAYLIVGVCESDDFLQMSAYQGSASLDFPQITPRQRKIRPMVEKTCNELGLTLVVSSGSDGSEFLDYELPKNPEEITAIIKQLLVQVFDANSETVLEIEGHGFDMPVD